MQEGRQGNGKRRTVAAEQHSTHHPFVFARAIRFCVKVIYALAVKPANMRLFASSTAEEEEETTPPPPPPLLAPVARVLSSFTRR